MKTKKTAKKVKITNYKKAYEELSRKYERLEHKNEELNMKYTQLGRVSNRIMPTLSACLAAEDIKTAAYNEMREVRNEVIKHDV